MGETTKIQWADATINFWIGCTAVSPGCANCYAEALAARFGWAKWGAGQSRYERLDAARSEARKLERRAVRDGVRYRAFVNSLSDVFDAEVPHEWRLQVFEAIQECPHVDFLLLTKRVDQALAFFGGTSGAGLDAPPLRNLWLSVTVEDQKRADERLPKLLRCPAAVRGVSYEPALEAVDFRPWLGPTRRRLKWNGNAVVGRWDDVGETEHTLDWIVVGGESGPGARPFDLAWARSTVEAGRSAGVPVFVKQMGARPYDSAELGREDLGVVAIRYREGWRDKKGGDTSEWPAELRVREFPEVPAHAR